MINERTNYVEGFSIADVWRYVMLLCVKRGYDFVVKGGSYVGQIRRQLDHVMVVIKEPWLRPLSPIMPPGLPGPTSDEKIEAYFVRYLMDDMTAENEQYTYGTYIKPQLPRLIELLLQSKGNTNQACISIGERGSINLSDPPCLRVMDFKVVEGRLNLSVYFRSWDLYAGLPENLGGFQLVKEYVLAHIADALGVQDGNLIAYSAGLHLYEQYFDIANTLNLDKIEVREGVKMDKAKFSKTLG